MGCRVRNSRCIETNTHTDILKSDKVLGKRGSLEPLGLHTQIPTETKVQFINLLTAAGLQAVETTSFVSPKAVPQLADAAAVMQGIKQQPGVRYPVLVPNMKAGLFATLTMRIVHSFAALQVGHC